MFGKISIVIEKPRTEVLKNKDGLLEDKQKKQTIEEIKKVLSKRFKCINLVFDDNIVKNLKKEQVDLVFNLCNGIKGNDRLSQLPAILEYAGIPYTGSSPLSHGLAYNKIYSSILFKKIGVPTPDFIYVYNIMELEDVNLNYPVLVKPKDEGSSRGIYENSLVYNKKELIKKVEEDLKIYNPPILINEYIEGREFTVGILGNDENLKVLPILEIDFSNLPKDLNNIYSFEVKNYYGDKTTYHVPARLDNRIKRVIEKTSIKAYNILGMEDYARVDIRLKKDIPYVLEINSLPGLMKGHSDITKMAKAAGLDYEGLIMTIVKNAMKRQNII
mgnify:CR=1 FL=1